MQSIAILQWNHFTVPVKYCSFGVSSVNEMSPSAYLASWAHAAAILLERFPSLWNSPESLLSNRKNIRVSLDEAVMNHNASLTHDDESSVGTLVISSTLLPGCNTAYLHKLCQLTSTFA